MILFSVLPSFLCSPFCLLTFYVLFINSKLHSADCLHPLSPAYVHMHQVFYLFHLLVSPRALDLLRPGWAAFSMCYSGVTLLCLFTVLLEMSFASLLYQIYYFLCSPVCYIISWVQLEETKTTPAVSNREGFKIEMSTSKLLEVLEEWARGWASRNARNRTAALLCQGAESSAT